MVVIITSCLPYFFLLGALVLLYKSRGFSSLLMVVGFAMIIFVDLHLWWGETYPVVQQADGSYWPSPEGERVGRILSYISSVGGVLSSLGLLVFALLYKSGDGKGV